MAGNIIDSKTIDTMLQEIINAESNGKEPIDKILIYMFLELYGSMKKDTDPVLYTHIAHAVEDPATVTGVDQAALIAYDKLKELLEACKNYIDQNNVLPNQKYIKPANFVAPITKLTDVLFNPGENKAFVNEGDIVVGSHKKTDIVVKAETYMLDTTGAKIPSNLTPAEREVLNGVISIFASEEKRAGTAAAEQSVFTARQVYEAFAGRGTYDKAKIAEIENQIDKLRTTLCSIDWTEHAKLNGISNIDSIVVKEPYLMVKSATFESGGQIVTGYQFVSAPVMYRYAKAIGQIITVPRKLLNVDASNTSEAIVLKNYMLRRIEGMKNEKNKIASNTILFETMFKDCGIIGGDKTQNKRRRNIVYSILDSWKKQQYIKAYKENKKGQTIRGVEIQF